jgi:hypothetical protein
METVCSGGIKCRMNNDGKEINYRNRISHMADDAKEMSNKLTNELHGAEFFLRS